MPNVYGFYVLREKVEGDGYSVKERYFLTYAKAREALEKSYNELYADFDKREVGGIVACPRAYARMTTEEYRGHYELWWYETLYEGEILYRDFEDRLDN